VAFTPVLGPVNTATAQVFPSRPITMVVPFAAGGPNDTIGRIVTERMRISLGQPVIIENVTGANGTIKAYAVTAKSRLDAAPDIPTVDEGGLPGFYTSAWYALWVPKGTPGTVIAELNGAVVDALAEPAVRARLADLGQVIAARDEQTPQALGAYHRAEIEKWWPMIKAANIKAE
jgi:tripartite-type tricarboxylate transporter receptor subunit TctC